MSRASLIATLSLLLSMSLVSEPAGRGLQALTHAALDRAREWYEEHLERIEQALRPRRARCAVLAAQRPGEDGFRHTSTLALGQATRSATRSKAPPDTRRTNVTLLDVCGNAARVKVDLHDWIDRIHLSRIDGRWVIVEVSWGFTPGAEKKYHIPVELWLDSR